MQPWPNNVFLVFPCLASAMELGAPRILVISLQVKTLVSSETHQSMTGPIRDNNFPLFNLHIHVS